MTNYVPGHKHDVFVSYAHVDDLAPAGVETGWVTTLIRELRNLLAGHLGRLGPDSVWMDHKLSGNDPVTPALMDTVQESATLLLVLSEGYKASPWCNREKDAFLSKLPKVSKTGASIFVVEKQFIERDERPAELQDLKGYKFWNQDPDDHAYRTLGYPCPRPLEEPEYYDSIETLSREIAKKLKEKKAIQEPSDDEQPTEDKTAVFLAEVTDDLWEKRERVKSYLEQHDLRVLPKRAYPLQPQEFAQRMEHDLKDCKVYVQLLSGLTGRRVEEAENGFPHLQSEIARASGLPILQWYQPGLDLDSIEHAPQKELLERETVMAVPIEEFKAKVANDATHQEPATEANSDAFVFLNHGHEDAEFARKIGTIVDGLGLGYAMPLSEGRPAELRKDLEFNLKESDAIVLLYGQSKLPWVREQLQNVRKIAFRRTDGNPVLALCEGPPEEKEQVGMRLPGMTTIDCRGGFTEGAIRDFLQGVAALNPA